MVWGSGDPRNGLAGHLVRLPSRCGLGCSHLKAWPGRKALLKVTHSQGCRLEASVPRHFWQDSWPPRERVVQHRGRRGRSHIVFFFLDSFMRHDLHTIPFTHLNSTTQCFFSIFTGLCNHPLYLVPELLLQMKSSHSPLPPPSTSWQTPIYFMFL